MERQNKKNPQTGSVGQLFPAVLYFVFVLSTVFTILIGSRVYENIRSRDNESFHTDTALAYITNKVRQGDMADSVQVREVDGTSVLILYSDFGGMPYETWIYESEGVLRELFTDSGSGLGIADGLEIMDCPSLRFQLEETNGGDSLLTINLGGADAGMTDTDETDVGHTAYDKAGSAALLLRCSQKGGA